MANDNQMNPMITPAILRGRKSSAAANWTPGTHGMHATGWLEAGAGGWRLSLNICRVQDMYSRDAPPGDMSFLFLSYVIVYPIEMKVFKDSTVTNNTYKEKNSIKKA